MPEEVKKDYMAIIKIHSKTHSRDYLYGYIQCLHTHELVNLEEAMVLVDYATKKDLIKRGIKT